MAKLRKALCSKPFISMFTAWVMYSLIVAPHMWKSDLRLGSGIFLGLLLVCVTASLVEAKITDFYAKNLNSITHKEKHDD